MPTYMARRFNISSKVILSICHYTTVPGQNISTAWKFYNFTKMLKQMDVLRFQSYKLAYLSPVINRIVFELFDRLIARVFYI